METEEKIIFSIQIDQSDSVNKIANLTKEIDSLKQANKQLALTEGDNTKAITENNLLIKQATDERARQSKAVLASMDAFGKESKSIDDARSAVKQLTIERNKLDISTDAGKKKQLELNNSIDQHNKFIKENVDQYQQQKINIGNYTSALSGIKGPIGNAIQSLQGMKDGFTAASEGMAKADINMKSLNGIFKANVIGIVVLALSGLIAAFSRFEPLIEKVEFIFSGVSQAMDVLISRFIDIGKAIATLDFKNFSLNLQGVGTEMKNAYNEGYKLAQMFDSIEERQTDGIIAQSKYERAVASLNVQLKNKTKTQAELIEISDKIAALDKEEIERKLAIANTEVKAFAIRNTAAVKNQKITEAMRVEFVNAYAEREKIQQEFEVATERRENRVDAINQKFQTKREADRAKADANLKKAEETALKDREDKLKRNQTVTQQAEDYRIQKAKEASEEIKFIENERVTSLTNQLASQLITQEKFEQSMLQIKLDSLESEKKLLEKKGEDITSIELSIAQQKLAIKQKEVTTKKQFDKADIESSRMVANAATGVINELASAAAQGSDLQKALALTNIAINLGTAIGNLTATTSAPSPDNLATGGIAGFVKYAAGLAQIIGAITSAQNIIGGAAAGGGDFMTTGPTMLLVGDNPGGRERVTVEPISGRGQTTINPNSGLIAMAGGGTLTTTGYGGYSQRNSKSGGMIDYDMLAKSFSKLPSPSLHITELNKVQNNQQKVLVKASL